MSELFEVHAYKEARRFLANKITLDDKESALLQYLTPSLDISKNAPLINEIYKRMLLSAQNANMKAGVIGGSIDGIDRLDKVLLSFSPHGVVEKYANPDCILDIIIRDLKPRGEIRRTNRSLWPKYCETILSSASFFSQFCDGGEFIEWAKHFYNDKRTISALPLLMAEEIEGIGYALACDFLKELGFINYGKPDVHVKNIFEGIGVVDFGVSPYHIQKAIVKIAEANNVSAYHVDKLFWLIGSGKLYLHKDCYGADLFIGRNGSEFVKAFCKTTQ